MDEFLVKLIEQAPTVGVLVLIAMWQARTNAQLIQTIVQLVRECDCDKKSSVDKTTP